jgi:hypothetical protein
MVAFHFEDTDWDARPEFNEPLGDLRFRQLFTRAEWQALPPSVRERFGRKVQVGDALIYRGHVEHNRMNRWGRALANVLRIIGAPFPLDTQNAGAAAVVTVTEAPDGGQIWMRQYARQDARAPFPQVIQSAKRFTGPTGIEEHIGRGIGMSLRACVEDGELVFRAEDIFWQLGGLRLSLPRWLGPIDLRAGHEEIGKGRFVFTLRLKHKWFGEMLDQRVAFHDDVGVGS